MVKNGCRTEKSTPSSCSGGCAENGTSKSDRGFVDDSSGRFHYGDEHNRGRLDVSGCAVRRRHRHFLIATRNTGPRPRPSTTTISSSKEHRTRRRRFSNGGCSAAGLRCLRLLGVPTLDAPPAALSAVVVVFGVLVAATTANSFSCSNRAIGYYADLQNACQDFHVCDGSQHHKFKCPDGTIFDERHQICDWKTRVVCPVSLPISDGPKAADVPAATNGLSAITQHETKTAHEFKPDFKDAKIHFQFPPHKNEGFPERPRLAHDAQHQIRQHPLHDQNSLFFNRLGLLADEHIHHEAPSKELFREPHIKTHMVFSKKADGQIPLPAPQNELLIPGGPFTIAYQVDADDHENKPQFSPKPKFPHHHSTRADIPPNSGSSKLLNPFKLVSLQKQGHNKGRVAISPNRSFPNIVEGQQKVLVFGSPPHLGKNRAEEITVIGDLPHFATRRSGIQEFESHQVYPIFARSDKGQQDFEDLSFRSTPETPPRLSQHQQKPTYGAPGKTGNRPRVRLPDLGGAAIDLTRFVPPEPLSFDLTDARIAQPSSIELAGLETSRRSESQAVFNQLSARQEDVELPFTGFMENEFKFRRLFPASAQAGPHGKRHGNNSFNNRQRNQEVNVRQKRDVIINGTKADDGEHHVGENEIATPNSSKTTELVKSTTWIPINGRMPPRLSKDKDESEVSTTAAPHTTTPSNKSSTPSPVLVSALNHRKDLLAKNAQKKAKQRLKDYLEKKLKETATNGNHDSEPGLPMQKLSPVEPPQVSKRRLSQINIHKPKLSSRTNQTTITGHKDEEVVTNDLRNAESKLSSSASTRRTFREDPVEKLLQFQKEQEDKEAGKAKVAETILSRRLEEAHKLAADEGESNELPQGRSNTQEALVESATALPLTIRNRGTSKSPERPQNKQFQPRQLQVDFNIQDNQTDFLPQPPPMLFPFISPSLLPFLTPPLTDEQREAVLSRQTRNFQVSFNNQNHPNGNQGQGHHHQHQNNQEHSNELQKQFHNQNNLHGQQHSDEHQEQVDHHHGHQPNGGQQQFNPLHNNQQQSNEHQGQFNQNLHQHNFHGPPNGIGNHNHEHGQHFDEAHNEGHAGNAHEGQFFQPGNNRIPHGHAHPHGLFQNVNRQGTPAVDDHQHHQEFQGVVPPVNNDVRRDDRLVSGESGELSGEAEEPENENELLVDEPRPQHIRRASGDDFFVNGPKMMFKVKVVPHIVDEIEDPGFPSNDDPLLNQKRQTNHALHQFLLQQQQQQHNLNSSRKREKKNKKKKGKHNLTRGGSKHRPEFGQTLADDPGDDDPSLFLIDPSSEGQGDSGQDNQEDVNKEVDQFVGNTGFGGNAGHPNAQNQGFGFHSGSGGQRPSFFLNALSGQHRPGLGNFRPSRLRPAAALRPHSHGLQQMAHDHEQLLGSVGFSGSGSGNKNKKNNKNTNKGSGNFHSSAGDFGSLEHDAGQSQGIPGAGQDFDNPNGAFTPGALSHATAFGNIDIGQLAHPSQQNNLFGGSRILNGLFNHLANLGVGAGAGSGGGFHGHPHHQQQFHSPSAAALNAFHGQRVGANVGNFPGFFNRAQQGPPQFIPVRPNQQQQQQQVPPGQALVPGRPVPGGLPPQGFVPPPFRRNLNRFVGGGGLNLRRHHPNNLLRAVRIPGHPGFLAHDIRRMSLPQGIPGLRPPSPPPAVRGFQVVDRSLGDMIHKAVKGGGSRSASNTAPKPALLLGDNFNDAVPVPEGDDEDDGPGLHFHFHSIDGNSGAPPSSEGNIVGAAIKPGFTPALGVLGEDPSGFKGEDGEEEHLFERDEEDAADEDGGKSKSDKFANLKNKLLSPFTLFRHHTENKQSSGGGGGGGDDDKAQQRIGRASDKRLGDEDEDINDDSEVEENFPDEEFAARTRKGKSVGDQILNLGKNENLTENKVDSTEETVTPKPEEKNEPPRSSEEIKSEEAKPNQKGDETETEKHNEQTTTRHPTLFRELIKGRNLKSIRELPKAVHAFFKRAPP